MKREIELAFGIDEEVFFLVRLKSGEDHVTIPVAGRVAAAYKFVTADPAADLAGTHDLYRVQAIGDPKVTWNLKGSELFHQAVAAIKGAQDENGSRFWGSGIPPSVINEEVKP